jgi:hypothetical protein
VFSLIYANNPGKGTSQLTWTIGSLLRCTNSRVKLFIGFQARRPTNLNDVVVVSISPSRQTLRKSIQILKAVASFHKHPCHRLQPSPIRPYITYVAGKVSLISKNSVFRYDIQLCVTHGCLWSLWLDTYWYVLRSWFSTTCSPSLC